MFEEQNKLIDEVQENLSKSQHDYEVLMTQFNALNMEVLDYKQELSGLKEQKAELLDKLGMSDEASEALQLKQDVRL